MGQDGGLAGLCQSLATGCAAKLHSGELWESLLQDIRDSAHTAGSHKIVLVKLTAGGAAGHEQAKSIVPTTAS